MIEVLGGVGMNGNQGEPAFWNPPQEPHKATHTRCLPVFSYLGWVCFKMGDPHNGGFSGEVPIFTPQRVLLPGLWEMTTSVIQQ